jgi:predicted acyl esterase
VQEVSEQQVLVELDVPAKMRDGVTLRANVYRPPEGRWPVLLTRLPYGKDLGVGSAALDPIQAARRGYVVIAQDTRGRFASEGEWNPFESEAEDGFDTIAWAPVCHTRTARWACSVFRIWASRSGPPRSCSRRR